MAFDKEHNGPEDWESTDSRRDKQMEEQLNEVEITAMLSELWAANANIRAAHASYLRLQAVSATVNYGELAQALMEIVKSTNEMINTPDFLQGESISDKVVNDLLKKKMN